MSIITGVADLYPNQIRKGCAEIVKYQINMEESRFFNIFQGNSLGYTYPGTYVKLLVNNQLMMSDAPMERKTNIDFVRKAEGRVLIAGLGVGLILKAILDKPEVSEVWVIEKYQDVIDLVAERFRHPKLMIICADIFEFNLPKTQKFDTIYFDIWPNICTDNLKEMSVLHRKFAKNKANKSSFIESWYRKYLRSIKRKGG
jgi:hypothetical protein